MAPRSVTPQSMPKYLITIFQTLPPILIAIFLIQIFLHCISLEHLWKIHFSAPCEGEEIVSLIRRPKNKSTDLMNIHVFIYKILASLITPTVSMLFNNSVNEGIFPKCFKTAKIIPILKSVDSNSTANYRPIFMLPFLSKMLEKLMCARLGSYLKSSNILCPNQFGFRKISNTSDAIIEFLDHVYSSLEKKPSTIAVYLDFSTAFDTVNHGILMSKLQHNGISGVMLSWFKSYLNNIKQSVSVKNSSSFMSNITLGVPQGSVLGQVLSLLYINDMHRSSDQMRFTYLADDTTVFASDSDINNVHATVNRELVGVDNWLKANNFLSTSVKLHI